uniref:Polyketide synthase n=1 Tax=Peronospora matthiolae TaxID=2874970 RepID=A0AAV1T7C2_9STRA
MSSRTAYGTVSRGLDEGKRCVAGFGFEEGENDRRRGAALFANHLNSNALCVLTLSLQLQQATEMTVEHYAVGNFGVRTFSEAAVAHAAAGEQTGG